MAEINWEEKNILKIVHDVKYQISDDLRDLIEPWLTAIFQSEHLSLLIGNGLTIALSKLAGIKAPTLDRLNFVHLHGQKIKSFAQNLAKASGRETPNFENDIQAALELYRGLSILGDPSAPDLREEINQHLRGLIKSVMETEKQFTETDPDKVLMAEDYLRSFLMGFASRTAARERLHIFTTNYDRFIEYGCDRSAILLLDRFVGKIAPVLRSTRLELDYHYNPPGIRGEPRYVEGVARITKLHGSVDWVFGEKEIQRVPMGFGATSEPAANPFEQAVIFPNPAKDLQVGFHPYSELFRDFGYSIGRPNSTLFTYGYSFGDSHINSVIESMLTIPSTHLVIVSYGDSVGKVRQFAQRVNNSQLTLLLGNHFGDLPILVDKYLPKPAIDRISAAAQRVKESRGLAPAVDGSEETTK